MTTVSTQISEGQDLSGEGRRPMQIVVIIGHPIPGSLSHALAARYVAELHGESRADVMISVIDLAETRVPLHVYPAREQLRAKAGRDHLDPQVRTWLETVERADHLVWFFPQWWGTYPAVLKAFIDSVFLSGVAFVYDERLPKGLWGGKTSRAFATMDSPKWWNSMWYRNAMMSSLNRAVLRYVGVKPLPSSVFTPVRSSEPTVRTRWLLQVAATARSDVRLLARRKNRLGR